MNEQKLSCPKCQSELATPSEPGEILCTHCGCKVNFVGDPLTHFRSRIGAAIREAMSLGVHIDLMILTMDLIHDELLTMRKMEAAKQAAQPPLIVPAGGMPARQIKPNGA